MTDLRQTIAPKSDQINADDLIGSTLTIKVSKVSLCGEPDQPIAINFDGDQGKPYKPCKSMRRVLVNVWGSDGNAYIGRSMTLYRDDKVQFGGFAVGGIRISHMSDIAEPVTMALTATRANRKPFTVQPLAVEDKAAIYAAELVHRLGVCQSIDDYNEVVGNKSVAKNLVSMKDKRPDLWGRVEDARAAALDRLSDQNDAQPTGPQMNLAGQTA